MTDRELDRLNGQFVRRVGRNRFGGPLYKWAFLPSLWHWRCDRSGYKWRFVKLAKAPAGGLWIPRRPFEKVPSFSRLGDRWAVVRHEFIDDIEWHRRMGSDAVWPPQGEYFPTDAVLKPGLQPSMSLTDYMIEGIKETWTRPAMEFEQSVVDEMEREERFKFRTLYDMIEDSLSAFGKKPGSVEGGVSLPSVQPKPKGRM